MPAEGGGPGRGGGGGGARHASAPCCKPALGPAQNTLTRAPRASEAGLPRRRVRGQPNAACAGARPTRALQPLPQVVVLPPPAPELRAKAVDAPELPLTDHQQAAEKILKRALGVQPVRREVQRGAAWRAGAGAGRAAGQSWRAGSSRCRHTASTQPPAPLHASQHPARRWWGAHGQNRAPLGKLYWMSPPSNGTVSTS